MPQPGGGLRRLLEGLHPPDGFLHLGVEILDTEACPVEAGGGKRLHMLRGNRPRIDLDRNLCVGKNRKGCTEMP